jgi:hypothetical protein
MNRLAMPILAALLLAACSDPKGTCLGEDRAMKFCKVNTPKAECAAGEFHPEKGQEGLARCKTLGFDYDSWPNVREKQEEGLRKNETVLFSKTKSQ